jgi:hypothetical protein
MDRTDSSCPVVVWILANMPGESWRSALSTAMRSRTVLVLESTVGDTVETFPLNVRPGCAVTSTTAGIPAWTCARSFS